MNLIDSTRAGFETDAGPIKLYQGVGSTFPGVLSIEVSRSSGVSPCTVIFSARNTTRNSYDVHQVLGTGGATNIGYYWDFGDPGSGSFNTFNNTSKNISVGSFMAAHTFEVADGGGSQTFTVACRAKDAAGNEALAFVDITVQAQDDYYSAANTIAISNTLTPGNWHLNGEDRNPPSGYVEHTSIASAFASLNVDDCTGKRIMLYRGDDFTAEGTNIKILSGNNNFHWTWFGDDDSGTSLTASTISFTAPTEANQNNGIGGYIDDSGSGLGSFVVGAEITVSGTANNNRRFVIRSVSAAQITVRFLGNTIVTEGATGSFTLTEHNKRPEVYRMLVGVDQSGNPNLDMTDAQLAANASTFGNDGFCENVYIDGLRIADIALGNSYQQVTIHNVDMDHEDTAADVNADLGKISFGNADFCWTNPTTLDPDSVPFSKGIYISDTRLIGSTANIAANGWPTINLSAVNVACLTWHCLIGVTARTANEMNQRIGGYQNFITHDSDFLGQHLNGTGGKGRLLYRGAGPNQVGDYSALKRGDIAPNDDDETLLPYCKWGAAQYVYDSASGEGLSVFSGVESSSTLGYQLQEDVIWTHYTVDVNASQCPGTQIIIEGCRFVCVTDVTYKPATTGIQDANANMTNLNNGPNNVVIDGAKSTQANFLTSPDTTYLDGPGQSAYNLPVPTAPR